MGRLLTKGVVWVLLSAALAGGMAATLGCERREPPNPFSLDLGDGDRPLLPPAPPWKDVSVLDGGSSEWAPFQALDLDAEEDHEAHQAGSDEPDEGDEGGVKADIRDLLTEFNELAAKRDYEEMPYYFVEAQRDALTKMLNAQTELVSKITNLGKLLKEKAPDSAEVIDSIMGDQLIDQSMTLDVGELTVKEPTLVVGSLGGSYDNPMIPPAAREIKFHYVDEEWVIDWPLLASNDAIAAAMAAGPAQIQQLIDMIESGTVPAEQIIQQMQAMKAMIDAAGAGNAEHADTDHESGEDHGEHMDEESGMDHDEHLDGDSDEDHGMDAQEEEDHHDSGADHHDDKNEDKDDSEDEEP